MPSGDLVIRLIKVDGIWSLGLDGSTPWGGSEHGCSFFFCPFFCIMGQTTEDTEPGERQQG